MTPRGETRAGSIAAVVLDMDGLLLDTEPIYRRASRLAAAELGYEFGNELYNSLIGRAVADVEAAIVGSLGAAFPMGEFRGRWSTWWQRIVSDEGIAVKSGARELLAALDARGIPAALATSTHASRARVSLRAAGLERRFAVVTTGDEVSRGKPEPDIFLLAAHRLGVAGALCLAFEDSEPGIIAARRAGMYTILIPDLTQPTAGALAAADQVFNSLDAALPIVIDAIPAITV
jgi:HAD superfamily hydrolase (TIGR01509 family)